MKTDHPITLLCETLEVSRSGYHAWASGDNLGKARVARLMREEGLQGRQRGRFRPRTTDSNHDGPIAPNRLAQAGAIIACDQVWQT